MEETELIRRAKEKDERAFEQLVEIYKPIIERFAFQFGVNDEAIPDIVQEAFIKIYRKLHQYHKGKLSTWIYTITLNVTKDHYRKKKRNVHLFQKAKRTHQLEYTYGYYFEKEEHIIIHECLQQLDLKYRLPLILYYFHDRTYDEIAIILKIKLSAVKTRMHRGKRKLKESYENMEGEEELLHGRKTFG